MNVLTSDEFDQAISSSSLVSPRLKRELRFVKSVESIPEERWAEAEIIPVTDRAGNKGVLLAQPDDQVVILPYELKTVLTSSTGKAQAIICDLCRTWQVGTRAGSITFLKDKRGVKSVSFLCCADLMCSRHVRNQTSASKTSRSQLREDVTVEQRIERLKDRLRYIITEVGA